MIETRQLSKRYGAAVAVHALSFQAPAGCVTGFLGPNGAGKSTTLRMILGLCSPTAGEALIDGVPYRRLKEPIRVVGAVLDASAVDGGRTAYDHLRWLARTASIPPRRIDEVVTRTGIEGVAQRRAGELSLGMKQRLAIAAALLGDPGTLVLDEPLNGLDPEGVRWLRSLLRSLASEGRAVLLSSHLMSEMEITADRLIVIGAGRLLAHTSVRDLLAAEGVQIVVRGPDPQALARRLHAAGAQVRDLGQGRLAVHGTDEAAVARVAGQAGIAPHEIRPLRPSLEDAYMRLTEGHPADRSAAPGGERHP